MENLKVSRFTVGRILKEEGIFKPRKIQRSHGLPKIELIDRLQKIYFYLVVDCRQGDVFEN